METGTKLVVIQNCTAKCAEGDFKMWRGETSGFLGFVVYSHDTDGIEIAINHPKTGNAITAVVPAACVAVA